MMHWFVYYENVNTKEIEQFDIFRHASFNKDIQKLKKKKLSLEEFDKELDRKSMYYFWSKSEYEVIITSWPAYIDREEYIRITNEITDIKNKDKIFKVVNISPTVGTKVSIYDQLKLNWSAFVNYVYNYKYARGEKR